MLGSSASPYNDPKNPDFGWKYIYTKNAGWMDLAHFSEAARWSRHIGQWATQACGVGVEVMQDVHGTWSTRSIDELDGVGSSAFTKEDLPSNKQGAIFGKTLTNSTPLSQQLRNYFENLGATAPGDAPDFGDLPRTEADHEQQWKAEQHERAKKWWERDHIPDEDAWVFQQFP